jgi:aminoglycoside 6'-N-acetyltransferase I
MLRIVDLLPTDSANIDAVASLLFAGFADLSPTYLPTIELAREAVFETFGDEHVSRIALDEYHQVAGFIAGGPSYGRVWEMHPLVVSAAHRRRGVARELVSDLARIAAARGALTLFASTSDESNRTSLYGADLYHDPLGALYQLRSTREHPNDFYLRLGFTLVGVLPDAEGHGQPSIHFALRLSR